MPSARLKRHLSDSRQRTPREQLDYSPFQLLPLSFKLLMLFALFFLPSTSGLVDCVDGFIGRMQVSIQDSFYLVNDTRMCSAPFCIKVFVHGALDDGEAFQQGISSRCGYMGGDRQLCVTTEGGCTSRKHYDGMHGNFTVCCCESTGCNSAMPSDLTSIYDSPHSRRGRQHSSSSVLQLAFPVILLLTSYCL